MADSENSEALGLGVSPSAATLDRPGTTQRSGGRIAMTVLRPQQQQQAATALPQLLSPSTAQQAQQTATPVPPQPGAASHDPKRSFLGAKQVSCAPAGCIAAWTSAHADGVAAGKTVFESMTCCMLSLSKAFAITVKQVLAVQVLSCNMRCCTPTCIV